VYEKGALLPMCKNIVYTSNLVNLIFFRNVF
jgi:hypothetical protein